MIMEATYMTAGASMACLAMMPVGLFMRGKVAILVAALLAKDEDIAGLTKDILASDAGRAEVERENEDWVSAEKYWDAERARLNIDLASAKHELVRIGLRRNAKGQLERVPKAKADSGEKV